MESNTAQEEEKDDGIKLTGAMNELYSKSVDINEARATPTYY